MELEVKSLKERIMKKHLYQILSCGIIGLMFWVVPELLSNHIQYTAAEFYLKYRSLSMTMSCLSIIACICCLHKLREEENTNENNR